MNGHVGEEKIALLAGGDLDPHEASALYAHIARCPSCSALLAAYHEKRHDLAAFRDARIATSDFDEVRQSVLGRLPGEKAGRFWLNSWISFSWLQWVVVAALILAAVALGTWWRGGGRGLPTARQAAPPEAASSKQASLQRAPAAAGAPAGTRAEPPAAQIAASRPAVKPQIPKPKPPAELVRPTADVAGLSTPTASPPVVQDDVAIKLETSDPNVIIIWLASPKGAGR